MTWLLSITGMCYVWTLSPIVFISSFVATPTPANGYREAHQGRLFPFLREEFPWIEYPRSSFVDWTRLII
jgi:hypothetical protein